MKKAEKFVSKYYFWLILLLAVPAVWALFVPGFYGASDDIHIAWLQQMDKVVREGRFPPRYVPDVSYGFGYPLFNFVFPLPFYAAELLHLIGFSLVASIKAVFVLSFLLSGLLMYKLLREFASSLLSLIAALVYMFTPYRATDVFVRGALGESVAFVFLPLIIVCLLKVIKKDQKTLNKWIGFGSLSIAGLIASHNITAYMFLPLAVLFALILIFISRNKKSSLLKVVLIFIFGLLISLYFWLPALYESRLMQFEYTQFGFVDHFPTLKQLITPHFGYGASVAGPYDGMSFYFGSANLLILVLGGALFLSKKRKIEKTAKFLIIWALGIVGLALFMMNHRSTFVWQVVPLIKNFQFPWRFLTITTFATPLLLIIFEKSRLKILFIFLIALAVISSVSYFRPEDFLGRTDTYYLERYIPFPSASAEYQKTSEDYFRLPRNTLTRPDKNYPRFYSSSEDISINKVVESNSLDAWAEVSAAKPALLSYNKYLFPGWQVYLDEKQVSPQAGTPFGQIEIAVPKGEHRVEVLFRETALRKVLNLVSLIFLIVVLVFIFI
jgi:uncharacterized membrane protein